MDLYDAYWIGGILEYLRRVHHVKPQVKGEGYIIDNLISLKSDLQKFNICKEIWNEIDDTIKLLDRKYSDIQSLDLSDDVEFTKKIDMWDKAIEKEIINRITFEAPRGSLLDYQKLNQGLKEFFPKNIWENMSKIAKSDLQDASKSLLTASWTPAVMISLRAAEDAIRNYYKFKTHNDIVHKNMGEIIRELQNLPNSDKALMGYLDYIKETRNMAEHPDKIFNQREAEIALHQTIDLFHIIYEEITKTL
jgi:hypothetical protein